VAVPRSERNPPAGEARVRGDRAYDEIRGKILSGEYSDGTVLAEKDLAGSLKISRTPVRQALRRLHQEGLVEVGARRQMVVARVSPERRTEIFLIRRALESLAVERACAVMEEEEIDHLWLLLIRLRRAADAERYEQFIDLDEEMHLRLAAGAQLPMLVKMIEQLRAFVRLMGLAVVVAHKERVLEVLREHEEIVEAVERRDAPAAKAALHSHLDATERILSEEAPATG
jgi:DNA-binding GntR family transcriptional regulator